MASEQESRTRYSNVYNVELLLSVQYTPPFIQIIQIFILHMISALPTAVGMNILFCFIRESISSQIEQLK